MFAKYSLNVNIWGLNAIIGFNFLSKNNLKYKTYISQELLKKNIQTQVHYIPIYKQPYYKGINKLSYRGSNEYYAKSLSLPIYETLKKKDIVYICNIIKKIIKKHTL